MCLPSVLVSLKWYTCCNLPFSTPRQTVVRVPMAASSSSLAPSVTGWMGNMLCLVSTCSKSPGVPAHRHPCRAAVKTNSENQNLLNWEEPRGIIKTNSWPCTGHPKNPTLCLRTLSKFSCTSGSLGAVIIPWSACSGPNHLWVWTAHSSLLACAIWGICATWYCDGSLLDHCWNETFFHRLALIQISVQCTVFVHKSLYQCRGHRWVKGLSSPLSERAELSPEFWTVILWNRIC